MSSKLDKLIASYNSVECEFNVDKSIEVCKEILKINPNLIEFQENLACDYYENKELQDNLFNDDHYLFAYSLLNVDEEKLPILYKIKAQTHAMTH